ncbi:hypothetical protein [Streptomyces sp. NPDC058457]|uniref:hypothetical protein n=1 Tax=Streptomyces sp. NPDC058457 TaxID=3346507 RepID=UPI0036534EC1
MPEPRGHNHKDGDELLAKAEQRLDCLNDQTRTVKRERRRLRRVRRAERARARVRAGLPVVRDGLTIIAATAFVIGLVLVVTGLGDATVFIDLAVAAAALAALM